MKVIFGSIGEVFNWQSTFLNTYKLYIQQKTKELKLKKEKNYH